MQRKCFCVATAMPTFMGPISWPLDTSEAFSAADATDLLTTTSRVRIPFHPLLPAFVLSALAPTICPFAHHVIGFLLALALGNLRSVVRNGRMEIICDRRLV
eukprot:Gb_09645 [translate_table: standard]